MIPEDKAKYLSILADLEAALLVTGEIKADWEDNFPMFGEPSPAFQVNLIGARVIHSSLRDAVAQIRRFTANLEPKNP